MPLIAAEPAARTESTAAKGPLRVCPANPRYFTDGSGKAIYLTGSHWPNFQNWGNIKLADFDAYLDFLQAHNHNFTRLWVDDTAWSPPHTDNSGKKLDGSYCEPQPFVRTGPGDALDGKPKFDLTKLNQAYFDELRRHVAAAQHRGIYVSVMLFDTWGVSGYLPFLPHNKEWQGNPYNAANNVNGIDGDPNGDGKGIEIHSLDIPVVTRIEETYVRKAVDTLNDLDNVLYEICNEGGSLEWNQYFADFIHDYEARKPKQHPVGITAPADNEKLMAARADWIAVYGADGKSRFTTPYEIDPPAADGKKVIIVDTDHIELPRDSTDLHVPEIWVWKSFTRGLNPIHLDPMAPLGTDTPDLPGTENARRAMGNTRRYATRMNLAEVVPHGELASTGYCLSDPGREYLVYLPEGGDVTLDLSAVNGQLAAEWMHPVEGTLIQSGTVDGAAKRTLKAPFDGDAVLYLRSNGPLRVCSSNPRYFTDGSGKPIYMTGSHTWSNFQNWGIHKAVDFDAYLDFLQAHNHNFTRLWVTDTAWSPPATDKSGKKVEGDYCEPQPFVRTGPGDALDGKPKFDLTKLNQAYFDELRRRVAAAQQRGIYVSVMLFDTWGVSGYQPYSPGNIQWKGSPYNAANNINGINGDPKDEGKGIAIHTLDTPAITRIEEAYARKVVDTLYDLDNLIYEVCNEGGTLEWNQYFADFIRDCEAKKPKQHPIGITSPNDNEKLTAARADWVAVWGAEWKLHFKTPYEINPPAADGKKVRIADTDHIELPRDSTDPHVPAIWVWKSFTRGLNPILMDNMATLGTGTPDRPGAENARQAMGHTRRCAERMNLAASTPRPELASTGYCLATPGTEYLVYLPEGGEVKVDLSGAKGKFSVEWMHPITGKITLGANLDGGKWQPLKAPFEGNAVLFIWQSGR